MEIVCIFFFFWKINNRKVVNAKNSEWLFAKGLCSLPFPKIDAPN
jgi:hypothetical protein